MTIKYPGLPPQLGHKGTWMHPESKLARYRSGLLPETAETVIIGSGFSGVSVGYHHPEGTIILEARDFCSGASGRNGGHIAPNLFEFVDLEEVELSKSNKSAFTALQKRYCQKLNFELLNLATLKQLIEDLEFDDCEFQYSELDGVCVYFTERDAKRARAQVALLQSWGLSLPVRIFIGPEAVKHTGIGNAKCAITCPAATINPYRLVDRLASSAISNGLRLYTNTPVERVVPCIIDDEYFHKVHVRDRTVPILAKNVVLATNAFIDALIPALSTAANAPGPLVCPVKGQLLEVGATDLQQGLLVGTSLVFGDEYLVKRRDVGTLVLGGFRRYGTNRGIGNTDDNMVDDAVETALEGFMGSLLRIDPALLDKKDSWTGIMGFSRDNEPIVGRIATNCESLYVIGGFTGHGMPRIFKCGEYIAGLIAKNASSVRLPELYRASRLGASLAADR
ncbi:hypothetical protein CANCADRAFT_30491 [Tortispora caseinolytica NRRL Y-17796]|uniref:FAD dependent oxidoreductase domain-containing protein n=1 Tax=Tortispora caseinolytica NRRL Y-17796 TaxID=767744 RepID=A0A1E4TKW0_9ASCO|nr:hypothetical protein CANCADRAFT_30491 [Tortispora caseinolytica NRRL Y-17796]